MGCGEVILTGKNGWDGGESRRSLSGLSWINRLTIKAVRRRVAAAGPLDSGNGYDRAENCCRWPCAAGQFHTALFCFSPLQIRRNTKLPAYCRSMLCLRPLASTARCSVHTNGSTWHTGNDDTF